MRRVVLGCALLTAACAKDAPRPAAVRSERARDSVLGASKLPGATGVSGALRLSDSATARRAREDTAGQVP